ncbi:MULTISPECIES: hypothetical protein [unclassified Rhodococcus (in: high G+C Gram-positive bacteria)]|nr:MULTISPECIES: hypothetical protein [unclassified Rhodococcus (in: high G+C Gram-positive bacteria)]
MSVSIPLFDPALVLREVDDDAQPSTTLIERARWITRDLPLPCYSWKAH